MTWLARLATALLLIPTTLVAAPPSRPARVALVLPPATGAMAVPADEELERRGARIGRVDVLVDDVFESSSALSAPYRIANGLHITTQHDTVRQQLLFSTGEPYSQRVLAETERLLRGQRYLNEATVQPVRYNEDNTVDVLVRVHDVWTLSPGFSFGRKGGENSTRLNFEDTNFLGLGKELSATRSSDVDRTTWSLAYKDPNLLGSWWRLTAAYSSATDGSENALALERPFYSLDTRWSANVAGQDSTSAVSRYSLGRALEQLYMDRRAFELGAGYSEGLRDGWATRYLAGVRYDRRSFAAPLDQPTVSIPQERVVAYPWMGVEVIEDEYITTRNLDQIGRTEDLYLGRSARLETGFASTAFGSTRDALMLRGAFRAGAELGNEQYMINTLELEGRIEGGEMAGTQLDLGSRYYLRQSAKRVFYASLSGSLAANLDPEDQLLLGGDNGLRGYPLRYQAGTASALVTLEERFYTDWQPLKLVNVGAALFFDAGRTWGTDPYAAPPAGWLKDIGIGLRLGSARSALGNVLHIDLAVPLDRREGMDGLQLIIETRRTF